MAMCRMFGLAISRSRVQPVGCREDRDSATERCMSFGVGNRSLPGPFFCRLTQIPTGNLETRSDFLYGVENGARLQSREVESMAAMKLCHQLSYEDA
jgi:hypothetical protein